MEELAGQSGDGEMSGLREWERWGWRLGQAGDCDCCTLEKEKQRAGAAEEAVVTLKDPDCPTIWLSRRAYLPQLRKSEQQPCSGLSFARLCRASGEQRATLTGERIQRWAMATQGSWDRYRDRPWVEPQLPGEPRPRQG